MNKYLNTTLLYGIFGGLACSVWFISVYYSGANAFYSFPQKLVILVQGTVVYLGIRYHRSKYSTEEFSFAEGIFTGLCISLALSIISSLFMYIFSQYIHPEMVAAHVEELKKYLLLNKEELIKQSSVEVYEGNFKNVDGVTAYTLMLDELIWKMIRGLMFSILASLTLRRQKESAV